MTQGGDERKRHGGGAWLGVVLMLLVVAVAARFLWSQASDDVELRPEARGVVGEDRSNWKVTAEPLQRTTGFAVATLAPEDLRGNDHAEALLAADGKMTLLLNATEHAGLTAFLEPHVPDGWTDPYGYGVAWRVGHAVHRLVHEPMDVL